MEFKEQLKELKNILLSFKKEKMEEAPVQMGEAVLQDGTIIKYEGETPAQGAKVVVVTEEGEVPAPDGTHTLEDGTQIMVEGGMITEVVPAEPAPEDLATDDTAAKIASLEERLNKLEGSEKLSEEKLKAAEATIEKMRKFQEEQFTLIEKLAAIPAEKKTETKFIIAQKKKPEGVQALIAKVKAENGN